MANCRYGEKVQTIGKGPVWHILSVEMMVLHLDPSLGEVYIPFTCYFGFAGLPRVDYSRTEVGTRPSASHMMNTSSHARVSRLPHSTLDAILGFLFWDTSHTRLLRSQSAEQREIH